MLRRSSTIHQPNLFGTDLLMQLDPSTAKGNLIVGVVSHEQNLHDSNTLPEILRHVEISRGKAAKQAVCDRGYRGRGEVNGTQIILPGIALKKDSDTRKDKKRKNAKGEQRLNPLLATLNQITAWQGIT